MAESSGDDDASPLEGPLLELLEDVVDFVELAFLSDHANFSLAGQLHQLPELVPVAFEAPEDGEFGEDKLDGFHAQRPPIPDDDQPPPLMEPLHPGRNGKSVTYHDKFDLVPALHGGVH